jgi:hypothetical protein
MLSNAMLQARRMVHLGQLVFYAAVGLRCPWLWHPAPARRLEAPATTGHFKPAAAYKEANMRSYQSHTQDPPKSHDIGYGHLLRLLPHENAS